MDSLKSTPTIFFLFAFVTLNFAIVSKAATFEVRNNCQQPVWAASSAPGKPASGRRLGQGETWTVTADPGTTQGRIWGRTNCNFDGSGRGSCETGDCNGALECTSYGQAPNTLAEYTIGGFANQDFIDISVIDGFNLPMEFSSNSPQCSRVIRCVGNIIGECPAQLRMNNACNGPCPVLKTEEHCCNSGNCQPTDLSRFFKQRCPDAYSYPKDDPTSLFTCPTGTNYKVIFCP
ncbi:PREDICTED: pathogenesis-related protein R major form-like [Tarenaya hassleriana]|uniref:pathogenesis-related protein R major form-like n=1 Tax=Tarenaya hassleriana TaxID=28532 RepID=UPI00053C3FCD|nr:PREDICTED: pathogenesis-related protein R major form-like [Tarenaya hassleriana]